MSKLIKKFQEPDGSIELQVTLEQKDSPLIDERYWDFYDAWNKLDANLSSVASEYSDLDLEKIYNSKDKNNYGDYNKIYDPETKLYRAEYLEAITKPFTALLVGDSNNLNIQTPNKYPELLKGVVNFLDYWYGSPTTLAIYLQNQKEIAQGIPQLMHNIHDIYGGYNNYYKVDNGAFKIDGDKTRVLDADGNTRYGWTHQLQRNLDIAANDTFYRGRLMNEGLRASLYRDSINDNLKQDNQDLNPEQTRDLIQSSIQRAVDNTVFKVNDKEKGFLYIPESYNDLKKLIKNAYEYWDPHHYKGNAVGYAVFADRPELKEQFEASTPNLAGYKSYLDFLDNLMHEFGHIVQFTNNPGLSNYRFAVDYKDVYGKTQKRPAELGESFSSHSESTAMADEKKLEEIANKYGFGLGKDIDGKDNIYWDGGKELRLRLLDIRYQLWKKGLIDPTKRNITAEDLKKFRETIGDSYQLNDKFLNRYPDEMLMEMFNTVASTTPSFNTRGVKHKYSLGNNTAFVKEGSKLIPKQTIGKFQNPAGPLRAKWDKVNEYAAPVAKAASSFIPLVGTYQDYKTFKENPTWGNAGWLALSALGDALTLTGVGAGAGTAIKAGRAARVANAAYDTVNAVRRTGDALDTMADAGKAVDAVLKVKTSYDLTNSYINT